MQGPEYSRVLLFKGQSCQIYKQPLNDPKENVSFKRAGALLLVGAVSWSRWILKQRLNIKAAKLQSVTQEKSMPSGQVD